jgi:mono/diheme cytochrome c family protein
VPGRSLIGLAALVLVAGAAGLWLTRPVSLPADAVAGLAGDAARGERQFWAGGCASCHAPAEAEDAARLVLAGGEPLETPFGTFVAPNISPDPEAGIGSWSTLDFANAMLRGVSPEGAHYYPAFPYTSYARMSLQDVVDLKAFLDTLPASDAQSPPHALAFPYNIRRGLGLWKQRYLVSDWVVEDLPDAPALAGRALVEGAGHCGECHTPRDGFGGLDTARWLEGAPNPTGRGQIPPLAGPDFDWSAADIAYYLETGFTPAFDSAGGHMAAVVENMAELSAEDRQAIAAYLKALPAD